LLLQVDTRGTPYSQPLCADLSSSVTHGIGSITDIPISVVTAALRSRFKHYIFALWFLSFIFFLA